MEKWWRDRQRDRKRKEQESAEAISGLKKIYMAKSQVLDKNEQKEILTPQKIAENLFR